MRSCNLVGFFDQARWASRISSGENLRCSSGNSPTGIAAGDFNRGGDALAPGETPDWKDHKPQESSSLRQDQQLHLVIMELFIREPLLRMPSGNLHPCSHKNGHHYKEFLPKTWLYRRKIRNSWRFLPYSEDAAVRKFHTQKPKST